MHLLSLQATGKFSWEALFKCAFYLLSINYVPENGRIAFPWMSQYLVFGNAMASPRGRTVLCLGDLKDKRIFFMSLIGYIFIMGYSHWEIEKSHGDDVYWIKNET